MSRIGKLPVKIPSGVSVKTENNIVTVSGPKGSLSQKIEPEINITVENDKILVGRVKETGRSNALHGLYRSLINNMVQGVSVGWSKTLEMTGVGYKASMSGEDLVLNVGFSHQVKFPKIAGATYTVNEKEGKITVAGMDKQIVGEAAAKIRKIRPPEPYKGKGIHYLGEKIRRKAGKSAKAVGATK